MWLRRKNSCPTFFMDFLMNIADSHCPVTKTSCDALSAGQLKGYLSIKYQLFGLCRDGIRVALVKVRK